MIASLTCDQMALVSTARFAAKRHFPQAIPYTLQGPASKSVPKRNDRTLKSRANGPESFVQKNSESL